MKTIEERHSALPGAMRWVAIATAVLFQAIVWGTAQSSFSFWALAWRQEFGGRQAVLAGASTLAIILTAVASPIAGRLADAWSLRGVVLIGLGSFGLGLGILAVGRSLPEIIAVYGVSMGLAVAFAGPVVGQTLAARLFATRPGLAIGITTSGVSMGSVLMTPLVAMLMSRFAWRETAAIIACGIPIVATFAWFALPARNQERQPGHKTACPAAKFGRQAGSNRHEMFNSARNFAILVVLIVPQFTVLMGLLVNIAALGHDIGLSAAKSSILLASATACTIVGKIVIGRLADIVPGPILSFVSAFIMSLGFLLIRAGHSGNLMVVGMLLMGAGSAGIFPMQGILASRYFGTENVGRILGWLNLFFLVTALGGPIAAGIRDLTGSFDLFLLAAALVPLVSGLSVLGLRPP
jgi:MFS transporter, OFA family, oxalate/formate antiporter